MMMDKYDPCDDRMSRKCDTYVLNPVISLVEGKERDFRERNGRI